MDEVDTVCDLKIRLQRNFWDLNLIVAGAVQGSIELSGP
jgi:hypothetical protein